MSTIEKGKEALTNLLSVGHDSYLFPFAARAKANHIPYINLYWTLGWNQLNFSTYFVDSDNTHPYKGFDVLGRRIYQQVIANIQ